MKRLYWGVALFLGVAGMSGCSGSQKAVQPPSPVIAVQRPPVGMVQRPRAAVKVEPLVLEPPKEEVVVDDIDPSYPSLRYVNERLLAYGRKLSRWKEQDKEAAGQALPKEEQEKKMRCYREVRKMLGSYNAVRDKMIRVKKLDERTAAISAAEVFSLQRQDAEFLESDCGELLRDEIAGGLGWGSRSKNIDLDKLETLIARHFTAGEYEEVVQVWVHIPEDQRNRVSMRCRIHYANALMYLHQEEKAADVYHQVVEDMVQSDEQAMDLISLRRVLADLYTAAGNYRAAGEQYKKISQDYQNLGRLEEWARLQLSILDRAATGSPELAEYSSLLRNFLGFVPGKDGYNVAWEAEQFLIDYPYSPVTSNVDFIKEVSTKMADEWFAAQLHEVDRLVEEQKFVEAEEYLNTIPTDIISPEKQLQVKEKREALLLASAVHKETGKLEKLQALQHRWNEAMLLARDGHYDKALAAFHKLEETEYAEKAVAQIETLALEAANAERKQAAQLYRRYTKTADVQTQKQLLLDARQILKGILEKYPNVEIRSKVEDNLLRVEQEITSLDPQLLFNQQGQANGDSDGVDASFQLQPALPVVPAGEESVEDMIMGGSLP